VSTTFITKVLNRKKIHKLDSDLKDIQIKNDGLLDQIIKLEKELDKKKK